MKYLSVIVLIAFSSLSCERVIEFKGSDVDPKIVLYSLLKPDSLITAYVSASHAVFEEKYQPSQITNATVKLYRDDVFLETLTYVAPAPLPNSYPLSPYSKYVSQGVVPVPGSRYRLEVELSGFESVSAEAGLPEGVPIISLDTVEVKQEWSIMLTMKIKFRDPADKENLYRLTVRKTDGFYNGDKSQPYDPFYPIVVYTDDISYGTYDEPLIAPQQEDDFFGMYFSNTYNLFNDELISGKEYDLTFRTDYRRPDTEYYEFSHFYIDLQTVTEDLYRYLRSYTAHLQTRDNFLAEPVLVYTNVKNGLGIFGAVSVSEYALKIGEYPVEGVNYRDMNAPPR